MDVTQALAILRALGDGIDPHTGDVLPLDGPFQHPQTVRALFRAAEALEQMHDRETRTRPQPANAGKPWDAAEDACLCQGYDAGLTFKDLADRHGRTRGAIQSRLVKWGKLPPRAEGA